MKLIIKKVLKYIGVLGIAFVLSYSSVIEGLSPFGISFVAALSPGMMPFGIVGSIAGYVLSPAEEIIPIRYVATLLSFAVIRGALKGNKKVGQAKYTSLIAGVCCIITGFTVLFSTSFTFLSAAIYLFEAILASAAAYFFQIARTTTDWSLGLRSFTFPQRTALTVSGSLILMSLASVDFYHINIACLLASFIILSACVFGEKYSGCFVAGILGLIIALSTHNYYILAAYVLSGILASVFMPLGIVAQASAFIAGNLLTITVTETYADNIIYMIHVLLASLVFVSLPLGVAEKMENFFLLDEKEVTSNTESLICEKLHTVGDTISSIHDVLDKVVSRTGELYPEDVSLTALRSVVSQQFVNTSNILLNLSDMVRDDYVIDHESQGIIWKIVAEHNIKANCVTCTVDSTDKMFIQIETQNAVNNTNAISLTSEINTACERTFELPLIRDMGNALCIRFFERPVFSVNMGSFQISSSGAARCGDYYSSFLRDDGKFVMVLSDGMGTGSAAALDSAMSVEMIMELLKDGIDFSCALNLVNSAIMVKSGDETLATVDIVCIDTYSGKTDFYKAGAAATLVRHGRKVSKLKGVALPIGILDNVEFSHSFATLQKGDIVLMSSDGIWIGDEGWIIKQLSMFKGDNLDDLAQSIASDAKEIFSSLDDITVIAARMDAR